MMDIYFKYWQRIRRV